MGFVAFDARHDAVEVVVGEAPLERRGDLGVVLLEGKQPRGERIER